MRPKFAYPEPRDLRFERTQSPALQAMQFATEEVRRFDMIINTLASILATLAMLFVFGYCYA